jgi:hypothetical protein
MSKIDYKKELKQWYSASRHQPVMIDVPALHYLMIDGSGNPNTSPAYKEAVEALFTLSYLVL